MKPTTEAKIRPIIPCVMSSDTALPLFLPDEFGEDPLLDPVDPLELPELAGALGVKVAAVLDKHEVAAAAGLEGGLATIVAFPEKSQDWAFSLVS